MRLQLELLEACEAKLAYLMRVGFDRAHLLQALYAFDGLYVLALLTEHALDPWVVSAGVSYRF